MAKLMDRSAKALLEISEVNGTWDSDLKQAIRIRDALDRPDVQGFLKDARVPALAKHKFINQVFVEQLPWYWKSFLYQMIRDNLASEIVPVVTEYIGRLNQRLGRIEARVVSAIPLTIRQTDRIRNVLEKKTNLQVEIYSLVDPDVIGGFYVLIGGNVFDGTVRTELERIKESLKRGITNDHKA